MKNFIAAGNSIQVTAPVGGLIGGKLFKQGAIIGVVVADAAEGSEATIKISGAYSDCLKIAGTAFTKGDTLYYKDDGTGLTKTATSATFAGYAYADAASGDVLCSILLSH
jgi:predicted RecA/RadA family phage recombinase